jgi:hypothetical protein
MSPSETSVRNDCPETTRFAPPDGAAEVRFPNPEIKPYTGIFKNFSIIYAIAIPETA